MKNSLAAGMQNEKSASLYTLLLPPWTLSRKTVFPNHAQAACAWFGKTDFRESVQGGSKSVYKIRKITSGHTQVHYFVNFVTCQQGDFERKIHFWTLLKQLLHLIWRRILLIKSIYQCKNGNHDALFVAEIRQIWYLFWIVCIPGKSGSKIHEKLLENRVLTRETKKKLHFSKIVLPKNFGSLFWCHENFQYFLKKFQKS